MSRTCCNVIRQTVLAGLIALGAITVATAQTAESTTGLGQAWPNAADHSRSPNWHVYVFDRDGIRYIQINDRNGIEHAALGRTSDTTFVLPLGVEANEVTISSAAEGSKAALPIYQDEAISVTIDSQNDGTSRIAVQQACEPSGCIGGRLIGQ